MKLYRRQWKPFRVERTNDPEKPYKGKPYPEEEVPLDAILEVMPSNSRYMELLEKMLKEGKPRRYGKYSWKVEA